MATERQRARYSDARGVDTLVRCIVPHCDTYVVRRRGICSEHWFKLPADIRLAIQARSRDGDRAAWIAAVRKAARLLASGKAGR